MSPKTKKSLTALALLLPLAVFFVLAFGGTVREYDPSGLGNITGFVNSLLAGVASMIVGVVLRNITDRAVSGGKMSAMFRDTVVLGFMLATSGVLTLLIVNQLMSDRLLG